MQSALERSGINRPEIEQFLATADKLANDVFADQIAEQRRQAARFLVANMATADLATLTAQVLWDDFDRSFRSRESYSWGARVPFELFVHYVLPSRIAQEPYERWRRLLDHEIRQAVQGCTTMTEAALAVNKWCGQRVRFIQTEWRDQAPLATYRSGYGRCEEMMIICIAALRTAGIPARPCWTPSWATCDNNHAWVEVWCEDGWYYMGGCEPSDRLNRTWFAGPAQRAGMVNSVMYGHNDAFPTGEVVARELSDASIINSTAVYARTGQLAVSVSNAAGDPAADCPLSVCVFNYGSLKPLTKGQTLPDGTAEFTVGMGTFVVVVGDERGRAHAVVRSDPEATVSVPLRLEADAAPPSSFWLRYPTTAEAAELAAARPAGGAQAAVIFEPKLPEPRPLGRFAPGLNLRYERTVAGKPWADAMNAILTDACGNWNALAGAITMLPIKHLDDAYEFLARTSHLDRAEIPGGYVMDHVKNAWEYGQARLDDGRPVIPRSVYLDFVLNARIGREHITDWRGRLAQELASLRGGSASDTAAAIDAWSAANLVPTGRGRFGPIQNPGQAFRSRHVSKSERHIFLVGALRALGVPARLEGLGRGAEYYADGRWHLLGAAEPAEDRATPAGSDEQAGSSGAAATLRLRRTRGSEVLRDMETVSVCRFRDGLWEELGDLQMVVAEDGTFLFTLLPGEYLVTAGVRNGNGDSWVRAERVVLAEGEAATLVLDLTPPAEDAQHPLARELSPAAAAAAVGRGPALLFLFLPDHEPSLRMGEQVAALLPRLREEGIELRAYSLAPLTEAWPLASERAPDGLADLLELPRDETGHFSALPSILLIDSAGRPRVWVEGYDLNAASQLEAALAGTD